VAAELGELPFVEMITLFGSVAQKKAGDDSDLDMIIILDGRVEGPGAGGGLWAGVEVSRGRRGVFVRDLIGGNKP